MKSFQILVSKNRSHVMIQFFPDSYADLVQVITFLYRDRPAVGEEVLVCLADLAKRGPVTEVEGNDTVN